MSKSRHIKIWGICVLLALAAAIWIYTEVSSQRETQIRADQRLESGIALFKEKNYPEALEIFEDISPGAPREWYARYYQGSTYIMLKDYQSATIYLEQALVLNPTETQIMHALGVTYYKLGNLKLSKAYFAAVLEINPADEQAKGLMDIMADLERPEPEATPEDSAQEQVNGENHH